MLTSLLESFSGILEQGYTISLDWIGKFAQVIIEAVGIIGVGIIVFTLVLKAITLPFDIYQRVSMRKQNLIMKKMQPELEKLQQQYANDKNMYNKKMQELYKKNGYSMLGACLPTIISLVILIVAFSGFRTYSQYANLSMYEEMSAVYNAAILDEHAPALLTFAEASEGEDNLTGTWDEEKQTTVYTIVFEEGKVVAINSGFRLVEGEVKEVTFSVPAVCTLINADGIHKIRVTADSAENKYFLSYTYNFNMRETEYEFDSARVQAFINEDTNIVDPEAEEPVTVERARYNAAVEYTRAHAAENAVISDTACLENYIVLIGAEEAAAWYRDGNDAGFLWVKNLWFPDVSYKHPIQAQFKDFGSQLNKKITTRDGRECTINEIFGSQGEKYDYLTAGLDEEKGQANGYFVLIIPSIGLMLLSQFISMRSSKETSKYQTVDGQGAGTQKMMMFIMPIIYGIFAFTYSAAFSIYMVMSSAISLIVTLLSNLVIGKIFKKKEEEELSDRYSRKYDWQLTEKEKKRKEKREQKENKKKK